MTVKQWTRDRKWCKGTHCAHRPEPSTIPADLWEDDGPAVDFTTFTA